MTGLPHKNDHHNIMQKWLFPLMVSILPVLLSLHGLLDLVRDESLALDWG